MARLINIILSVLCMYLFGAYLRAKQCQQAWDSSLSTETYFWIKGGPTRATENKASTAHEVGATSVVAVTITNPPISKTKNYQGAKERSITIRRTTSVESHTVDVKLPATTQFVNPSKPPKCFRAFGKDWR